MQVILRRLLIAGAASHRRLGTGRRLARTGGVAGTQLREPELAAADRAEVGWAWASRPAGFVVLRVEVVRGPAREEHLDAVLGSGVDAVYISSRNHQHAEQAIAAAEAGKHILLEKPMALTMADARAVVSAARRHGVKLAVNHHLPGGPLHSTVRRLVAEGRIGILYSARINHAVLLPENFREWRPSAAPGASVPLDITVHDASVLNPLFGTEPLRVTALGSSQAPWNSHRTIDSVMTTIEYAAGDGVPKLAQTHDAFAVPFPGTSMEVHGEQGAIVVQDAMTPTTAGTVSVHYADGPVTDVPTGAGEDLYSINIRRFREFVEDRGTPTATADTPPSTVVEMPGSSRAAWASFSPTRA